MIKMRPYVCSHRPAIRDSMEDDLSEDIEDEVFIKDARSSKRNEERGLKRPLMTSTRRSTAANSFFSFQDSKYLFRKPQRCYNHYCENLCYALAILAVFIAGFSLILFFLSISSSYQKDLSSWWNPKSIDSSNLLEAQILQKKSTTVNKIVPCSQISVQKIWSQVFPRINSESPLRKADLNNDQVLDIIFGFGVDDHIQYEGYSLPKCKSSLFNDEVQCEGGVIAVDGQSGQLIWQSWSISNVFSLLCSWDINQDGYADCIAAGKLGMIFAINGRNGNNIWEFQEMQVETNSAIIMDLYTINMVRDLDDDGIPEILAVNLEEREESKAGHIKLISGRTGNIIRSIPTPYREEGFVPVQLISAGGDGTETLLIITGGQNSPGGIYSLRLMSLMKYTSEKNFSVLHRLKHSGFMVPAVLTDITGDQMADIIVSAFNSTVMAFDGRQFNMIWNYTFPRSDSVSAIVPGHFNQDNITDFMIKYNTGPGFPIYYYSQTIILDGKNGQPLLTNIITDSGGASSLLGGISISQTFGGDFFLHWQMQCHGHAHERDAYEFIPDSDIIQQARADSCRLRYNSSSILKLYAIAEHIKLPGAVLFSTNDLDVHLNYTKPLKNIFFKSKMPLKHPKLTHKFWNKKHILDKKLREENNIRLTDDEDEMVKSNNLKEKLLNQVLSKDDLAPLNNTFEMKKGKNYSFYEGIIADSNLASKDISRDYENEGILSRFSNDEYDNNYLDDELVQLLPPNQHPIHLRTKYPARDIRRISSLNSEMESKITAQSLTSISTRKKQISKNGKRRTNKYKTVQPISLWDLEREQEERDAVNEIRKYRGKIPLRVDEEFSTQKTMVSKFSAKRNTRFSQDGVINDEDEQEKYKNNEWFLAAISSTGVLLKSLHQLKSSIDFAFILNVRESEAYPPLYQPQDLNCVEEKMSAYRSNTIESRRNLRKQFLKQCLKERIFPTSNDPIFESQLILIRLGITCICRFLQKNETCSQLESIEHQRWTQYMGNEGNGFY